MYVKMKHEEAVEFAEKLHELLPDAKCRFMHVKRPSDVTGGEYEVSLIVDDGDKTLRLTGWGENVHQARLNAVANGYQKGFPF